jgi:hypothetical protein
MKKEFQGPNKTAGKGKGPIKGYNYKNWNKNFDEINWTKKKSPKKLPPVIQQANLDGMDHSEHSEHDEIMREIMGHYQY